ncbi:MAG: DNA methyltransferase, partial [Burkholderiaceae bacterium]
QLENFQQKLWLKKKVVLETNWLITLDKVPASFYDEICQAAENPLQTLAWDEQALTQRLEWVELFGIQAAQGDLAGGTGYSIPLTATFLADNKSLVLDTVYLGTDLKERLLATFEDIEKSTNGLLIQGDNFQALNLLTQRFHQQIKSVYIDPPYNTGDDGFVYKDNYKESCWLSLIDDRISLARSLMAKDATISSSIDDEELGLLQTILDRQFGKPNRLPLVTIKRGSVTGHKVINPGVVRISEFLISYAMDKDSWAGNDIYSERERDSRYDTFIVDYEKSVDKWALCSLLDAFASSERVEKKKLRVLLGDAYESRIVEFVSANAERVVQLVTVNLAGVGKDFVEAVRLSGQSSNRVLRFARKGHSDVFLLGGKKLIFYKDKLGKRSMNSRLYKAGFSWLIPAYANSKAAVPLRLPRFSLPASPA